MAYSLIKGLEHSICRFYEVHSNSPTVQTTAKTPFSVSMQQSLIGDTIEIPCSISSYALCTLEDVYRYPHLKFKDSIIVPLMLLEDNNFRNNNEVKTSPAIIRRLFFDYNNEAILSEVISGESRYIGGKGIIMYNNYKPMMLITINVSPNFDSSREFLGFRINSVTFRIDPIIYRKDDILAKYLRGKFLTEIFKITDSLGNPITLRPYCCYGLRESFITPRRLEFKPNVSIEDLDKWFTKPVIPDTTTTYTAINKFLSANWDEYRKTIV